MRRFSARPKALGVIAAWAALVTGGTGMLQPPSSALATQATPAPDVPAASECTVAPRRLPSSIDVLTGAGSPIASPTPSPADLATPADDATVGAVTATIRQSVACANANDPLRSLALFTDRYVQERLGPNHPDDLGSLIAAASRTPLPAAPEDRLALVAVRDVRVLPDRRVTATVVTRNSSQSFEDRLILAKVGDRWLIDEVVAISPLGPGTPTP